MKDALNRFYAFLDRPLFGWSRIVLVVAVIPLVLAFGQPLWKISMTAPQYPKGLSLEIYAHTLESGNDGRDLQEINVLNHYIGMQEINRTELSDLDWIPFALVALMLLTLRCAAIGNVRMLVDLTVIAGFIGAFSLFRFVYKLYTYGHNLDPTAAIKVEPFTPAIFGSKQIANFTTTSYPQAGTYLIAVFALIVSGLTAWHLFKGRADAVKADREATKESSATTPPEGVSS